MADAEAERNALRIGVAGTGFWAAFQIAGWREVAGIELVGVWDRSRPRAEAMAERFGIPTVCPDLSSLLSSGIDAVDIITPPAHHPDAVLAAAAHKVPAICQKPLALSVAEAESMLAACDAAGVPLIVHENFRWQEPIRTLWEHVAAGVIGTPFRARITLTHNYPVFDNQPGLRDEERLILADVGVHLLDIARFFLGDVDRLAATTSQVRNGIRGEDVATVLAHHTSGATSISEMSCTTRTEQDDSPETLIRIEGSRGSISLEPGYRLMTVTASGTEVEQVVPRSYDWADPAYAVAHASIVRCHADIANALRTGVPAETDAHDNIKTLRLVEAAYVSAAQGVMVTLDCSPAQSARRRQRDAKRFPPKTPPRA